MFPASSLLTGMLGPGELYVVSFISTKECLGIQKRQRWVKTL